MEFNVKLSSFEGPFDLLLHLVEKAQVDINEISIAQITDDFLKAIKGMEALDLEVTSEFLVVAATLIDIKSRTLLPIKRSVGDSGELEDPRQELIRRLLEYKKYKEVSQAMLEMAGGAQCYHTRVPEVIEPQYRPVNLSLNQLFQAFQRALDRSEALKEKPESVHHIQKEEVSISQQMEYIYTTLKEKDCLSFSDLLLNSPSRYYIVISFLAVLELIRIKKIIVVQDELFSDINLFLREDETNGGE